MIRHLDFGLILILIATVMLVLNHLATSMGSGGSGKIQVLGVVIFALGGFFLISRMLSYVFPLLAILLIFFVAYRMFVK